MVVGVTVRHCSDLPQDLCGGSLPIYPPMPPFQTLAGAPSQAGNPQLPRRGRQNDTTPIWAVCVCVSP